ncbi:Conserved_hypothetical protein [Hexamita inflata]|uniref:Uncharacterized protein n=1 Tax=Hexamita inflata TaxID=28002 RepID=A0AA86USU8_9EUKA|nr:Conserved hypothetical protein [Hexamita inflata]
MLIYIINIQTVSVSSSFSECFSAKSYIKGNVATNELNLHLLPFERLDKITSENLCKMYLPGKVVVAKIHYDDISFPRLGDLEVNFLYQFNQEIVVSFTLSPTDYQHIFDKDDAMYELWYDVNLVKVNNSVNTIEHTKYNGTNCFQRAEMEYTIYGDIDIKVTANNCKVQFDPSLELYLEFQEDLQNDQIPIYPCLNDCLPTEYQSLSTNFSQISIYRIKQSASNAYLLASFYQQFIKNRRIPITFNIKFNTNGIYTIITRKFDKILAKDTWRCRTDDVHLALYAMLNPTNVLIQYRDSVLNKLLCDTQAAVKVHVDLYFYDPYSEVRVQKSVNIEAFNEDIGIEFDNSPQFVQLRKNFNPALTKAFTVVSYLDADDKILWEIAQQDQAYMGCVVRATLHLYEDRNCLRYSLDDDPRCTVQTISPGELNSFGVFYKEDGVSHSLGFYRFQNSIKYTDLQQELCFACDQYIDEPGYAKPTCKENQEYTKLKLKTAQVGFGIMNKCEFIVMNNVVAEYQTIFVPLIIVASVLVVTILITVIVFIAKMK